MSGFRLNENLLIGLGLVLGAAIGLLVSPYFFELKQVEGMVNTIEGLKEGVGDIVGGALGGVIAFLTAYFTVRWRFDRVEAKKENEKEALAEEMLLAIMPLAPALAAIDLELKKFSPPSISVFFQQKWILPKLVELCEVFAAWEKPDPILGRHIRRKIRLLKITGENSKQLFLDAQKVAGASPLGASFGLVYSAKLTSIQQISGISGLLEELISLLDEIFVPTGQS